MARAGYFGSYISRLVTDYPTPTAALRAWRAAGGHVRTQAFYEAFAAARAQLALAPWAAGRDLRFKPSEEDIISEPTVRASGFAHKVIIVGRLRSGEVIRQVATVVAGDTPMSRAAAIKKAEEWARGYLAKEGPQRTDMVTVYGGIHIGVVRREPGRL